MSTSREAAITQKPTLDWLKSLMRRTAPSAEALERAEAEERENNRLVQEHYARRDAQLDAERPTEVEIERSNKFWIEQTSPRCIRTARFVVPLNPRRNVARFARSFGRAKGRRGIRVRTHSSIVCSASALGDGDG